MRTTPVAFFIVLLTLFADHLLAQDNSMEQKIGWRGKVELHTITDKPKQQSCTFIAGVDSIKAIVVDNQLRIVQQFSFPHLINEQVLGGFFMDGRVYLFTDIDRNDLLHRWELDITTGNKTDKFLNVDLENAKLVDRISGGDRFLYFTVDKKRSEFIIYDFKQSDDFSMLRYNFAEEVWNDLTKAGLFKRSINVEKVDMEGECSLDVAVHKNKVYLHNNTLYLVMNNHVDSTQVFGFDLQNKKVDYRLIKHGSGSQGSENMFTVHNSFLLHDKLYYVRATVESLLLEVVDFYRGAAIKTFVAGKEDSISFKNTPIMQEGSASSATTSRELEKTGQLLRKMVNDDVVLTATPIGNGQIKLMIGSFTKVNKVTGGSFKYDMYGMWNPAGGYARNIWTKSARFKTLLNGNTGEHVDGTAGWSVNERIEKFTEEIQTPPQAENLFQMNNHYFYAFYDKTGRRLVILEF